MKQHQTLTREMQKLGVDGGDQCEASNPNLSTKTGAENALGRMQLGEGRVKREEEGIQTGRTRSKTREEKV